MVYMQRFVSHELGKNVIFQPIHINIKEIIDVYVKTSCKVVSW